MTAVGTPDPDLLDAEAHELIAAANTKFALAKRLRAAHASGEAVELIDIVNVERRLRLSPRVFSEAARRGDFPSTKRGRRIVAHRADIERWLEKSRRVQPKARANVVVAPSPSIPDFGSFEDAVAAQFGGSRRRSA